MVMAKFKVKVEVKVEVKVKVKVVSYIKSNFLTIIITTLNLFQNPFF